MHKYKKKSLSKNNTQKTWLTIYATKKINKLKYYSVVYTLYTLREIIYYILYTSDCKF